MDKNIIKIRIINKSKQGVILDMKEQGKKSVPWDTFNSMFVIVDNVWATFNEETLKKRERFDELMTDLCTWVMMHEADEKRGDNSKFLTHMGLIGGITKKIQEEFGFSMLQIMQEARKRIAIFRSPSTWKETPEEYKERHAKMQQEREKREREEKNYHQGTISNATESMSNVKGADKLKDLFKV